MKRESAASRGTIRSAIVACLLGVGVLIGVIYVVRQHRVTPIREIVSDPARYRDSAVTIAGIVVSRFESPLKYKPYEVADQSASMVVIVIGFPPSLGDHVRVTGVVKSPPFGLMSPVLVEAARSKARFP